MPELTLEYKELRLTILERLECTLTELNCYIDLYQTADGEGAVKTRRTIGKRMRELSNTLIPNYNRIAGNYGSLRFKGRIADTIITINTILEE